MLRYMTFVFRTLFIHSYADTIGQASRFAVRPSRIVNHVHHTIGATVWGRDSTSSDIFVCSESDAEDGTLAFHGAIDIESGQQSYLLDDHRSGEELVLDPEGEILSWDQRKHSLLTAVSRKQSSLVHGRRGEASSSIV
jgi:hypothetical protein